MEKTGIIWTEKTWNFIRAMYKKKKGWFCVHVNEGCRFCYAETLNLKWGNGLKYTAANLKSVEWYLAALNDPIKWKQPSLIFPCSMTDLFLKEIPDEFRHKGFDIMEATPQHEYQVLTKRPEYMYEFSLKRAFPKNLWAGITIPDEKARQTEAIKYLKKTKAEIHWISAEPMVSKIKFTEEDLTGIDQIITGGESGNHLWKGEIAESRALVRYNTTEKKWELREDRAQWLRHVRDLCQITGTKFFHKQHGGHYPEAGGRELDGRTWNEVPRFPGGKNHVDNQYLKKLEKDRGSNYGQVDLFK